MNVPFNKQKAGKFIAVARLSKIKQLDHIINTVTHLHQFFPQVTLDIYGYEDSWNQYQTAKTLKTIVKHRQAEDYIHFASYHDNLNTIYE